MVTFTNHPTGHWTSFYSSPWWVGSAAFSPDGRILALASADQTVTLRSTETWEAVSTLLGHDFEVWWVAYSSDGRKLITASKDNTIKIWDAAVRAKRDVPKIAQGTEFWVFSPNGTTLLRSFTNQTVTVTDIATLRETELPLSTPTNLARLAIANWCNSSARHDPFIPSLMRSRQGRLELGVSNEILLEYEETLTRLSGPARWEIVRRFLESATLFGLAVRHGFEP